MWKKTDRFTRFVAGWQHVLFYPVMAVAKFNLYGLSLQHIWTSKR